MNSNGFFPAGMSHAKVRLSVDHKTQCYICNTNGLKRSPVELQALAVF